MESDSPYVITYVYICPMYKTFFLAYIQSYCKKRRYPVFFHEDKKRRYPVFFHEDKKGGSPSFFLRTKYLSIGAEFFNADEFFGLAVLKSIGIHLNIIKIAHYF